jgi:hypothetical protein
MARLQELEVIEVSLVDLPANKRKFLLTKSDGGNPVDEMLALILETDMENEGDFDQALAELNLDEKTQQALKGAFKLLNAHRENLNPDIVKSLLTKAGFVEPAEDGDTKPTGVLMKEDGTLNLDDVPEHLRDSIQALWEGQKTAEQMKDELETTLKAERDAKRKKEFLQKAEGIKVPVKTDDLAEMLMKVEETLPDLYPQLETLLTQVGKLLEDSPALEELGDGRGAEGASAYDRAVSKARKLMESDASLSLPIAIDTVFKADRALAEEHRNETR